MSYVITAAQLRAARAILGFNQRTLAERAGLSLPTIQRMEASEACEGQIRGNIDSLSKLIAAFDSAGIEFLGDSSTSVGLGRGVRLKARAPATSAPMRR